MERMVCMVSTGKRQRGHLCGGISEYAVSAMNWAVGTGLMNGKSATTLNPKDNATRAEIAAILQRFIEANK